MLLTDNLSDQKVSASAKAAARTRSPSPHPHVTCRHRRVAEGEIEVAWGPDPENSSDFLTKWIPTAKFEASVKYAMGIALSAHVAG